MAKTKTKANKSDPAMEKVRELWEKKKAEGWTMQRLGEAMDYPADSARKSVSQFLKSHRPQVATLQRFASAVGVKFNVLVPTRGAAMTIGQKPALAEPAEPRELPFDPISAAMKTHEHARRTIVGVLESYNGNYDALAEAVQNGMDALEDASIHLQPGPYLLEITINLKENAISVFDSGIGMTRDQVCEACAPAVTFKDSDSAQTFITKRGDKHGYRGYKGVGLTFLAYGTNDIQIHSRQNGTITKGRMRDGRKWAEGHKDRPPLLEPDTTSTPLDSKHKRGTWVRVGFSSDTKPASLSALGTSFKMWEAIIRTRTAAGQVLIGRKELAPIKVKLKLVKGDGQEQTGDILPEFYCPHLVKRNPEFRFLDVWKYHQDHPGIADHPPEVRRQDGVYLTWTTEEIQSQLTEESRLQFARELTEFKPTLYAFRPYHAPVWTELNEQATDQVRAHFLSPGLVLAVDRQRMADVFSIKASRSELLAQNIFVLLHLDKAKPDQGRKTLQTQVMELSQDSADAAVQYLLRQSNLLKPAGEKTTAAQREVELNHEDWVDNVKIHAKASPLSLPPITYGSTPQTEQDVVGLFHQLSALGLFPGMTIFATSSQHTYDCYIQFNRRSGLEALRYRGLSDNPLGLSTDVLGPGETRFVTKGLTLEFKNNLEGLTNDIEHPQRKKTFAKIDICVCWSTVGKQHRSYQLTEITDGNIYERRYPGITHLLRKDGESHVIQIIMLETIAKQITAGHIILSKQ